MPLPNARLRAGREEVQREHVRRDERDREPDRTEQPLNAIGRVRRAREERDHLGPVLREHLVDEPAAEREPAELVPARVDEPRAAERRPERLEDRKRENEVPERPGAEDENRTRHGGRHFVAVPGDTAATALDSTTETLEARRAAFRTADVYAWRPLSRAARAALPGCRTYHRQSAIAPRS